MQAAADTVCGPVEHDQIHRHIRLLEERTDALHRGLQRQLFRIPVHARGDQRERDRFTAVRLREFQCVVIARRQLLGFAVRAVQPVRPDCMNDVPARQLIRLCQLGLTDFTAAQCIARRPQARARRLMDTPICAAAAGQRAVSRIDDGIHFHFYQIVPNDM